MKVNYTDHATKRMSEREISKQKVTNILDNGESFYLKEELWRFELENLCVIVDVSNMTVLTCVRADTFNATTGRWFFGKFRSEINFKGHKYRKIKTQNKRKRASFFINVKKRFEKYSNHKETT